MLQAPQGLHVDTRAPGDTMTVFSPPRDITPVESVIRWFFSVPQWVQLAGAGVALIVALIALVLVWRNARAIRAWMGDQHRTTSIFWKAAIGAVAMLVLLGMAGSGATFFVYSQNDNQFCLSCHTLHDEVYQRFQQSKHHRVANLRCHDCHAEPLVAETMQIVKWMLLRPSEVGPHAPVSRAVCANCHIKDKPDSTWQRIIATAGHTVHLASDTAQRLKIDCLTCHGVTAHRFVPVAQTCAQSGCHKQTEIQLGKMAGQTSLHCTTCHQFTAPVADTTSTESAIATLSPTAPNCLGCHEMRKVIERFVPANDPHKGRCGDCHNPHTQATPAAAFKSCSNSGCHTKPDTLTPFHRGEHVRALANCGACHQEHTWKVRGRSCLDCHQNIFKTPPKPMFRPPHTTGVVNDPTPVALLASAGDIAAIIGALPLGQQLPPPQERARIGNDTVTFSHAIHRPVPCASCHTATGETHGAVTIKSIRDCQRCHHETTVRSLGGGPAACQRCHESGSLPSRPQTVTVRTSTSSTATTRTLPFAHATHGAVSCTQCHTTPVTLAAAAATCNGCHADHHTAQRNCTTCHSAYDAHRGQQVHLTCAGSGCHTDRATLALTATRNVCLSCHTQQIEHKPGRDCATCHRVHWTSSTPGGAGRGPHRIERRL